MACRNGGTGEGRFIKTAGDAVRRFAYFGDTAQTIDFALCARAARKPGYKTGGMPIQYNDRETGRSRQPPRGGGVRKKTRRDYETGNNRMEMKPSDRKTLLRTMIVTGVIVLIVVPVLFYSLYKIQIRDAETLQSRAIAQQTRDMLVSPVRGAIYDRNMTALALSATVETIVISPAEIKDEAEAEFTARGLAEILDMDYETILKKTTNKKSYYEIVARKVDKEVSDAVREFKTENKLAGIKLFEDTKRYYPYSTLLSNVIGFTNYDNEGQYGLEMKYEEVLKGVVGRVITAKDRDGNAMSFYFEQYNDAQDGMSLVLTVDYGVQEILEKHLEVALAENGCDEGVLGIVMNPKTGEILAMAQKGDYDLNNPRTVNDEEILNSILAAPEDERSELMLEAMMEQWRNKAIQEPYEPGSVFKIITASIALEENVVNANSTFFCAAHGKSGQRQPATAGVWPATARRTLPSAAKIPATARLSTSR